MGLWLEINKGGSMNTQPEVSGWYIIGLIAIVIAAIGGAWALISAIETAPAWAIAMFLIWMFTRSKK